MKWIITVVCIWISINFLSAQGRASDRRKKARGPTNMLNTLMRDYSKLFRPNNGANATQVSVDVDMQDVFSLKEGTLEARVTFVAWLKLNWTDPRLSWDPDQHHIRDIRLEPQKIWTPDIKLINGLDPSVNRDWSITLMVAYDGMVRGTMPVHLSVHCGRPRDPHASWECPMVFRSWTYTVDDLNLQLAMNVSDTSMYNDRVWRITSNDARHAIETKDCCPGRYSQLTYTIRLIRH